MTAITVIMFYIVDGPNGPAHVTRFIQNRFSSEFKLQLAGWMALMLNRGQKL